MAIRVEQIDEDRYQVTVGGRTATTHTVTLKFEYWKKLTGGETAAVTLVEKSFEFLLERESNTSILRSFELPVIQQYFPEYEKTIRKMLA